MTTRLHSLTLTAACLGLAMTGAVHAHDLGSANDTYVGDSGSHLITDGFGNCVQTGTAADSHHRWNGWIDRRLPC